MLKQNIYTGWQSNMNFQVRIIIYIQHDNYRHISLCVGLLLHHLLKHVEGMFYYMPYYETDRKSSIVTKNKFFISSRNKIFQEFSQLKNNLDPCIIIVYVPFFNRLSFFYDSITLLSNFSPQPRQPYQRTVKRACTS